MSKYKVGDKFIIEIGAERLGDPILYRIKEFNTLVFDDNGLDRLERYDADAKAQQDEIKVGDEVMGVGDAKGIVTNIRENRMFILWGDGSAGKFVISDLFKKTGRHFYIKSIFEQLKGVDDGSC